ncbi:5-(carboxyamino)imidazole ribonucleotide synthase [Simiduia curdlanivorans]|uniref:N5-carboxyaminoimidazole ribonucleotide synthase n=1 Tax=Simiduia curdlanivorans TaxID=1492769 RepID=A0ABV8V2B5_9GAMM|nr:5-(carboxyamino)imidazole ribonucleotide synthase [Simiduia curdlanivorans]MDN3637611.1 5-(carboxyamino)imidazole ribonucleotide synthase [Simiduia curdlanivorans]
MKIGVLGGGQLARMIALAGVPLGYSFVVLDPSSDACATEAADLIQGAYDDTAALDKLAAVADVITYEFENVPQASARYLATKRPVYPAADVLHVAQDRLNEKTLFTQLGIQTPPYAAVNSLIELQDAVNSIGLPAVLKTRTQGYDGKGQAVIKTQAEMANAWASIGEVPAILEGFIAFDREISMIAVRNTAGEIRYYPVSENQHADGILRVARAKPGDAITPIAQRYTHKLLEHLDYVGVIAVEYFQRGEQLLANEFAPRVHNSGHWTIEGAECSQFENHVRAVANQPLGNTAALGHAAMVNLIGDLPSQAEVMTIADTHPHFYGKAPRPGRKVAHVGIRSQSAQALEATIAQVNKLKGATGA